LSYAKGLHEVGDGLYAYLQPDGGWGWSNAGLIAGGEHTLLVDTLYDLALTEEMLAAMRRAVPAAARIDTLVNTHANGDHCYGNQLVGDARIVASERTAAEMSELPPAAMAALLEQAPAMGELGAFFAGRAPGRQPRQHLQRARPRRAAQPARGVHPDGRAGARAIRAAAPAGGVTAWAGSPAGGVATGAGAAAGRSG
jgi:glyoxylase-like metal-dependent hydrolase (beta-lactamase superfamily II)